MHIKFLLNARFIFFIIFLGCASSLATAFYLEYVEHMDPCVLCWVQRILFGITGIICLIAAIHNPQAIGRRIYALLAMIFSALGILAAGRQIWLTFHHEISGCLPTTFVSIFEDNPFFDAIIKAFQGTPECGLLTDTILGLELPYWGVIFFGLFTLLLLFQLVRPNRP